LADGLGYKAPHQLAVTLKETTGVVILTQKIREPAQDTANRIVSTLSAALNSHVKDLTVIMSWTAVKPFETWQPRVNYLEIPDQRKQLGCRQRGFRDLIERPY